MKKRNRRILSLTIAVMMLLVTLLPSSAAGITLTPIVQTPAALTRILSAHPELSIASSQPLYSPTNEITAYYYTLSPTGYAIASVQGEVVEWSPTATRAIPTNQTVYYAGPLSYFTKSGASYVDVYSGEAYSAVIVAEQYAQYASTAQTYVVPADVAPAGITPPPGGPITTLSGSTPNIPTSYWHHSGTCGCGYDAICGTIAACMLVKYYNDYVCPGVVPPWCPSPNNSTLFIHYMVTYTQPDYTNPDLDAEDIDGASGDELANGINSFWSIHNRIDEYNGYSAVNESYDYTDYKAKISNGQPCIIATRQHGTYSNHYVLGYGWYEEYFDEVRSAAFCTVADGWGDVGVNIASSYMTHYGYMISISD